MKSKPLMITKETQTVVEDFPDQNNDVFHSSDGNDNIDDNTLSDAPKEKTVRRKAVAKRVTRSNQKEQ